MRKHSKRSHRLAKILVPTDFSASSDAAVDYATFVARRFGAAIDVLYVWDPRNESKDGGRTMFFTDSDAGRAMNRCLSEVDTASVLLRSRVEFGDLYSTVVRIADAEDFDLIVMGAHEGTAFSRLFSRSVAHKIAQSTDCPVVTIRASMEPATGIEVPPLWSDVDGDFDAAAFARWADDGGASAPLTVARA